MRWVTDRTGRFQKRPYYDSAELDVECEQIMSSFLAERHGRVVFPIATDDLTVLVERAVGDLDMYADLSGEVGEVEGVTEFRPGQKPRVRIAAALSAPHLENRLRTTLTHEFGHVHWHGILFELQPSGQLMFPVSKDAQVSKCKRETIVGAYESNWMEWQAGYACGALLMPATALRDEVRAFANAQNLPPGKLASGSSDGTALVANIARAFQVSGDAARVRLLQRGYMIDGTAAGNRSLFQEA
jgi:hypothetical protein